MRLQPGSMIYAPADLGQGWEFAFLIREESRIIRRFGPNPRFEIRSGLLVEERIALIPILVQVSRYDCVQLYETWLNPGCDLGRKALDLLVGDKRFLVQFYGDRGRERDLVVPNPEQNDFGDFRKLITTLPPWESGEFDRVRVGILKEYPDVPFWRALKDGGVLPSSNPPANEVSDLHPLIQRHFGPILVPGKIYPSELPEKLRHWYCYTRQGGH